MAEPPYDPYIPSNNAGSGSAPGGPPGNQRTAAIQQVGPRLSTSPPTGLANRIEIMTKELLHVVRAKGHYSEFLRSLARSRRRLKELSVYWLLGVSRRRWL